MSGQPYRIGIVGCGAVTQIAHLPALRLLGDLFEVACLCDVQRDVVTEVARYNGVKDCFTDYREMLNGADIAAVLVANPDASHTEVTLASIERGKHVLVEKPMCITVRECDDIIQATRGNDVVVQVGYMRRHSPAVAVAKQWLQELGPVHFARVHDIVGHNELIVDQVARVITGDLGAGGSERQQHARLSLLEEPSVPALVAHQNAYGLLLGLGCHDTSLAREMLGPPKAVIYCASRRNQSYITSAFDHGEFVSHFEIGVDDVPRYDTNIEVYCARGVVRVDFNTPYVRNLPVRARLLESSGRGVEERMLQTDWSDAFVHEWRNFHENIASKSQARMSPSDFRLDLELFTAMLGALGDG